MSASLSYHDPNGGTLVAVGEDIPSLFNPYNLISVDQFGAKPSVTDNRTALNEAIAAAEAAAAALFIPRGTYNVAGGIEVNLSGNIRIIGHGATIKQTPGSGNQLLAVLQPNVIIDGLTLDCDFPNNLGTLFHSGTSQAGGSIGSGSTHGIIKLAAGASASNTAYSGMLIKLTSGSGAGDIFLIESYNGTTKDLTISGTFRFTPDGVTYEIYSGGSGLGINNTGDGLLLRDVVIKNTRKHGILHQYGRIDCQNVRIITPGLSGIQCKGDEHYLDMYIEDWNNLNANENVRAVEADSQACDAEIISLNKVTLKLTKTRRFSDAILIDAGDNGVSDSNWTPFGNSGAAAAAGSSAAGAALSFCKFTLDAGHGFQVGDMIWVGDSSVTAYNHVQVITAIEGTGNVYVNVNATTGAITLYDSSENAIAGGATGKIAVTDSGVSGTTYISCVRSKTKYALGTITNADNSFLVPGNDFKTGMMARLFRGTSSTVMPGGLANAGTVTTSMPYSSAGTGATYQRPKRFRQVLMRDVDIDYMTSNVSSCNAIKINNTEDISMENVRITQPANQTGVDNWGVRLGQGNRNVTMKNVRSSGRMIINPEAYIPKLAMYDCEIGDGNSIPLYGIESFSVGQFTMHRSTVRASNAIFKMPETLERWDDRNLIEWDIAHTTFEGHSTSRVLLFRTDYNEHIRDVAGRVKWHDNILRNVKYAGVPVSGANVNTTLYTITTTGRSYVETGDLIRLDFTGAPSGLTAGAWYHARKLSETSFALYDTKADAFADINRKTFTTTGSGTRLIWNSKVGMAFSNTNEDRGWAFMRQFGVNGNEFMNYAIPSSTTMVFKRDNIIWNAHRRAGMPVGWRCTVDGSIGVNCGTFVEMPALGDGVLATNVTAVQNSGTGETDQITYTLPADTILQTGDALIIRAGWTFAANGNTKTVKLYLGSNTLLSVSAAQNGGSYYAEAIVTRNASNTSKVAVTAGTHGGSGTPLADVKGNVFSHTADFTTALTIKGTGQSSAASNDVAQEFLRVQRIPAVQAG